MGGRFIVSNLVLLATIGACGPGDGASPDAGGLDADLARLDGSLADGPECTTDLDCAPEQMCGAASTCITRTRSRYAISTIRVPATDGVSAIGFNLDALTSTGADCSTCVSCVPDYRSGSDPAELGIDNSISSRVSELGMVVREDCPSATPASGCVDYLLAQAIARGESILVLEVTDIDSWTYDDNVHVGLFAAAPDCGGATPCIPNVTGSGELSSDQSFILTSISEADGWISSGRLDASFASIDIAIFGGGGVPLMNSQLRATISPDFLRDGVLGGALRLDDLAAAAEASGAGRGVSARSAVSDVADLAPRASSPTTCDAISVGFAFSGVRAL